MLAAFPVFGLERCFGNALMLEYWGLCQKKKKKKRRKGENEKRFPMHPYMQPARGKITFPYPFVWLFGRAYLCI